MKFAVRGILIFFCLGISLMPAAANTSASPFGINVHLSENQVLQKVADAGIKWIRIDIFWSEIEPVQGTYNFFRPDRVIQFAHENDLSVLAILESTPGWANSNRGPNHPADDAADWQRFIRVTVDRYRDRVKYWNIWNEPNVPEFFGGGKEAFLDEVLLPGIEAVKSADSEALIVGPELAHLVSGGKEWYLWLRYILTRAGDQIDIISHHIYESLAVELLFQKLEGGEIVEGIVIPSVSSVIEEAGHQYKPFWITETGWDTGSVSEQRQADLYLDMLSIREDKRYPDKVFFYEIIDSPESEIPPWGILRQDLAEKPAYAAYRDYINGESPDSDSSCFLEDLIKSELAMGESEMLLRRIRQYRDEVLKTSEWGREMIALYYSLESRLSTLFRSSPRLRRISAGLVRQIASRLPLLRDSEQPEMMARNNNGFFTVHVE
jgi:hypothetical protein